MKNGVKKLLYRTMKEKKIRMDGWMEKKRGSSTVILNPCKQQEFKSEISL